MAELTVALNGIPVAVLDKRTSGALSFRYLSEWLQRPGARPISLSLPLSDTSYQGEKVLNFFDNLLPDSESIRTRIQSTFRVASSHPFDLLAAVGRDCIGAIQLYPLGSDIPDVQQMISEPLTDADIENLLAGYQQAPLGMDDDHDFRISLAGAQEKTALLWHQGGWQRPFGSTPTSHIFKLPIGFLEPRNIDLRLSGENEWLCLQILKEYGVPVPNAQLAQFGAQKALIVERFDRRWSSDSQWLMRLPQEDFCQALGVSPALKYENHGGPSIQDGMKLLQGSQASNADRELFFKVQILFWLLAAIDGHAKNFSVFLEPDSAYRMTPIYDVLSAYPLMAQGSLPTEKAKMAMSLKGKNRHYHWAKIEPRHFISTAGQIGYSTRRTMELMNEIVDMTEGVLARVKANLPEDFPVQVSQSIFDGVTFQSQRLNDFSLSV